MIRILFICMGNICRSPMAEFILKDMVRERGVEGEFDIASAAVSDEETGNGIYPPARAELARHGIGTKRLKEEVAAKTARRVRQSDYEDYDLLVAMDQSNIRYLMRRFAPDAEHKICRLLDFTDCPKDIDDPWYTRRFDVAYAEILKGCRALLDQY